MGDLVDVLERLKKNMDTRSLLNAPSNPSESIARTPTSPPNSAGSEQLAPAVSWDSNVAGSWVIHCALPHGWQRRMTLQLRVDGSCQGIFEATHASGVWPAIRGSFSGTWFVPTPGQFVLQGWLTQLGSILPTAFRELLAVNAFGTGWFRGQTASGEFWTGTRQSA
jgi:hypothetical protein